MLSYYIITCRSRLNETKFTNWQSAFLKNLPNTSGTECGHKEYMNTVQLEHFGLKNTMYYVRTGHFFTNFMFLYEMYLGAEKCPLPSNAP